ncbi:MAG: hypothetical protein RM368_21280 [Nostoc sp. DedSLP03]|uniref:hypothetical protein n=1 Tax=Nostoc sp. DedSLP03 TaxID=3075400 RepID=UPI002AD4EFCA|nr:hypothetical protein [Nostoc sp. DedSLP03]MDZ7967453.1 hypothetical protein [Nostoc sp. DedSLP03]
MIQDEPTFFSGSQHETINCWDLATGKCWTTLRPPRPYEGTMVNAATELMEAQISTSKAFEAVEVNSSCSMPTNFR